MAFEHYIRSGTRKLRMGYTTGTCAALAASGAVQLLLTGNIPVSVSVMTGKGILVEVPLDAAGQDTDSAWCAVKKDGGDDVDVTDGLLIRASVRKSKTPGVHIDGGQGVGRVTRPGLDQPVGNAAINRVPRQMITDAVTEACDRLNYHGGIDVLITVPDGEEAAKKTFNPMLGVLGGISILGTSGIVEPMSEKALVDTIEVELHQKALTSEDVILIPGNYGEDYLKERGWDQLGIPVVKFSNFLGDTMDILATEGYENALIVSHVGKMVKTAGGIMNTHSRWADCRMELFTAHAAICGADTSVCRRLMEAATTDACIEILREADLDRAVLKSLMDAIDQKIAHRAAGRFQVGAVMFSKIYGELGRTQTADCLLRQWKQLSDAKKNG